MELVLKRKQSSLYKRIVGRTENGGKHFGFTGGLELEKDERIKKIEETVDEFMKVRKEIDEIKNSLTKAQQKAKELKAKSELYARLEKVAGVQISTLGQYTMDEDISTLEGKIDELSKKEVELEKTILASLSDKSELPFGIGEPVRENEDTVFMIKEDFQIEGNFLKTIFELVDIDYPARIGDVVIESTKMIVENEEITQAVNKLAEVIEKIRSVARMSFEIFSDDTKLHKICEIINSSDKSYRPVVEEIGRNYPVPISYRDIANKTHMRPEAVASICSMLHQGKTWAGKLPILKKPSAGFFTFNELGRIIWSHYQKLCKIQVSYPEPEKEISKKEHVTLPNFA